MLPPRDEQLVGIEKFLAELLAGVPADPDHRVLAAYSTWRVLRRLRRQAERVARPHIYTRDARLQITAAPGS